MPQLMNRQQVPQSQLNPLVEALLHSLGGGRTPTGLEPGGFYNATQPTSFSMVPPPQALPQPQQPSMTGMPFQGNVQMPSIGSGVSATPSLPPQPSSAMGTEQSAQPNKMWEFIKALGIPLATAGVGEIFPGALPGAAGFNQGYVGSLEKDKEFNQKKELAGMGSDTYTFDPETGQYEAIGIRIPKNATIRNLTPKKKDELQSLIEAALGGDSVPEESVATTEINKNLDRSSREGDKRTQYNKLRSQGVSAEEAKRKLGL